MESLVNKRIRMLQKNQTFKTQLNSNGDMNFKVTLNSENQSITTQLTKQTQNISVEPQISSNTINSSGVVNNTPEDEFYDEIIFYDGGGVEGYGY